MSAKIIPFKFKTTEVRTIEENDLIWFVASDVAKVLTYRDADKLTRMLDDDERGTHIVGTLSGDQEMTVINESGLYHALLKSRKPEAQPFRKWVTAEVLPAIRKHGRYEAAREPAHADIIEAAKEMSIDEVNQILGAASAIKGRRLAPATLTSAQQRHVQNVVAKLASQPGNSFPQVYHSIKDRFGVGTYKDVPEEQYPALCRYLGVAPIEGELLSRDTPASTDEIVVSYKDHGYPGYYALKDMLNCGWITEINGFLNMLDQHKGRAVTLKIEDVSGLRKEVASLQHLSEVYYDRLEKVRDAALFAAREAKTEIASGIRA